MLIGMRANILPAAVLLVGAGVSAFEPPATFQASKILPARLVKGPHYTVAEPVEAPGFYQEFHIKSDFGEIEAEGRTVLHTRVTEVDALARLAEVSKTEVFAKAAGGAVLNIGKGVVSVVTDPVDTAKGIGAGVKRFGVNLGRKAKRTSDSVTKDDKKAEDADESGKDKALDTAGGAANSVFGVNGAARRWAQKLNVDPYTTNPVLHHALVDIGKIDSAGSIAAKIVVPIPMVVSGTATVGGLVWSADPEVVRKTNEARLAELGVSKDVASRYLINGNYTLTSQTRFIGALHAVNVPGCKDYVDSAADASVEREALFFVESAELLAGLHKRQRVSAILEDSRAIIARTGTSAVALLPVDWVRWSEELQKAAVDIPPRAKQELGATGLEVRISGTATQTAKAALASLGWKVTEHFTDGLLVTPADQPR